MAGQPSDHVMPPAGPAARIAVWDPVVRVGHWALVLAFAIAYLSAEEEGVDGPDLLHVWAGYAIGLIVVLRAIWGFIGPGNARFSTFAFGPMTALRYLADLARGRAKRYVGHSPAGGAMVIALLVCLAGTVGTGLVAYGDLGKGPLADAGGAAIAREADSSSHAKSEESVLGELHGTLANITLALIILHIIGVGLASVAHRENLVAAMISGRKRAGD